ncbi:MAG: PorV/PorQ family protein [Ignavibacteriaceae bacterium]
MKRITKNISLTFIISLLICSIGFAQQQKLGQTGMKFLNMSVDARISAFGDAVTSLENNATSMFYNPAAMANLDRTADLTLGSTQFIADINYYHAAVAFTPFDGDYGVFGFSFVSVDYGDFLGTIRANNEQGFVDIGTFSPTALAIGFGYAKALSEKFSIGGNVKYVRQSLGTSVIDAVDFNSGSNSYASTTAEENELDVMAFDFGVLYKTGFESLNIGMSVRNFAKEVKYKEEGFQLPIIFQIGASFNFSDIMNVNKDEHSFLVTVDANHPRDYPEQINFGLEYTFMEVLSLRGGYSSPNDERGFSTGVGLKKDLGGVDLGVDYGYTPFGVFNSVHRLTLNFAF